MNRNPIDDPVRCGWCLGDSVYVRYHDQEWGVPVHDDRRLFEFLVLEGAQAGLSWLTILKRRKGYRRAFCGFDPAQVAALGEADVARLLQDPSIIRHQGKIRAAITNARAFLDVQAAFGSFAAYSWAFVDGVPIVNRWRELRQIPATTPVSDAFARDLKRRGFRFVGSTTVYAHMQAVGMVNDHLVDCFRHGACGRQASSPGAGECEER